MKRIGYYAMPVEIYHVSVGDPSISLPLHKGKYKENFNLIYLHFY